MSSGRAIVILIVVVAVLALLGALWGLDVGGGSGGVDPPAPVGGY